MVAQIDWVFNAESHLAFRNSSRIELRFHPSHSQEYPVEQSKRVWRAAGDVNVHWDYHIDSAASGIVAAKNPAAATACSHSYDESRLRHSGVGFPQRELHIARHGSGDQQHIGVTG